MLGGVTPSVPKEVVMPAVVASRARAEVFKLVPAFAVTVPETVNVPLPALDVTVHDPVCAAVTGILD